MKRRQLLAGALTLVLTVSSCMQAIGLRALAAETGETVESSTADAVTEAFEGQSGDDAGNSEDGKTETGDTSEDDVSNAVTNVPLEDNSESSVIGISNDSSDQDEKSIPESVDEEDNESTDEAAQEQDGAENDDNDEVITAENASEVEEEPEESATGKKAKGARPIPFDNARGLTLDSTMSGVLNTFDEDEAYIYYNCYYFIPEEAGVYTFSGYTTYEFYRLDGAVYDSARNCISEASGEYDYDANKVPVSVQVYLNAGEIYYWVLSIDECEHTIVYASVERNGDDIDFICNRIGEKNRVVEPKEEITLSVNAYSTQSIAFQWRVGDEVIEGENTSTYSFVPQSNCTVVCNVLDESNNILGSVDYSVTIDNKLNAYSAESQEEYAYIHLNPNSTETLHVIASAVDMEGITYRWYKGGKIISGADSDSITIVADKNTSYKCRVQDLYGGVAEVEYDIYINNSLKVTIDGLGDESPDENGILYYKPNSSLTITAHVSATDTVGLKYKWSMNDGGDSPQTFTNLEGDTIEMIVSNPVNYTYYELTVVDRFGNRVRRGFDISVDNGFELSIEGEGPDPIRGYYSVCAGESIDLKATVKGEDLSNVTYNWTKYINPDQHFCEYDDIEELSDINVPEMDVTPTSAREWYELSATDRYGSYAFVVFYITTINNLKAYPEGNDEDDNTADIAIELENEVVLKTNVSAYDVNDMQYQWYVNEEEIEGENAAQLSYPVSQKGTYSCVVRDKYGYESIAYFNVSVDNQLTVRHEGDGNSAIGRKTVYTDPGESVELRTEVSALNGELTYEWYMDGEPIEGADTGYYQAAGDRTAVYKCCVSDEYGNTGYVEFKVVVNSKLTAYAEGTDNQSIRYIDTEPESGTCLRVIAESDSSAELQYSWYKGSSTQPSTEVIERQTEDSYILTKYDISILEENDRFICLVSDMYGNSRKVEFIFTNTDILFKVYPENAPAQSGIAEVKADPVTGKALLKTIVESNDPDIEYKWYKGIYGNNVISGETEDTLEITALEPCVYSCEVTNSIGMSSRISFFVTTHQFSVHAAEEDVLFGERDEYVSIYLQPGKHYILKPIVEADDTCEITYKWTNEYDNNDVTEGDSKEIVADGNKTIHLYVKDQYKNHYTIHYDIYVGNVTATFEGAERSKSGYGYVIYKKPDESKTITCHTEAIPGDEITIEWSATDPIYDIERAIGTGPSITITSNDYKSYQCTIRSKFSGFGTVEYLNIQNNYLSLSPLSNKVITKYGDKWGYESVQYGQSCTLETEADTYDDSHLTYNWYEMLYTDSINSSYDRYLLAGHDSSIEVRPDADKDYVCVVEDQYGNQASAYFHVSTVEAGETEEITILQHPQSAEVLPGEQVTMSVVAVGDGLNYQWQWSSDGENWNNCAGSGYNTDTFAFTMKALYNGRRYRCAVSSGDETAYTNAATATMKALEITRNPADAEVQPGGQVTMTVEAEGGNLGYQWQWSSDGETWKNCTSGGYNTDTFAFAMKAAYNGRQYRCKVTRDSETVYSAAATATLKALGIIRNPEDTEASIGEQVTMTVEADGTNLSYQWQWSSDGETWNNCFAEGYNTDTFSFVMKAAYNGRQYRCKVTRDSETVYSTAATVSLKALSIIHNPEDASVLEGEEVRMTVEAEGGDLSYQWQWSSNGETWNNCLAEGYNTDTFVFTMKAAYDGRQYRCAVTRGSETEYSQPGTATLKPVEFTHQPADTEAAAGEQVVLTIEAEGDNLSYQWQWSSDGETWKNCMGASYNTNAFTFTMKALYSGRQYRCMVTRGTQKGYSDAATVTIIQQ